MKRTSQGDKVREENREAFDKLAQAMYVSKGKVDTAFCLAIAERPNSTVEDIIRLGDIENSEELNYSRLWEMTRGNPKSIKDTNRENKFKYSFKDTFAYRYMEKLGLIEELEKDKNIFDEMRNKIFLISETHRWGEYNINTSYKDKRFLERLNSYSISTVATEFTNLINIPHSIRELVFQNEFVLKVWTSGEKRNIYFPWYKAYPTGCSDAQKKESERIFNKRYCEKKAEEVIALSNAPEDIRNEINKLFEEAKKKKEELKKRGAYFNSSYEYRFCPFADTWYTNERLKPWELAQEFEIEDFYRALNYMGLGIVRLDTGRISSGKNLRQFVKHVNSSTRRFVSDIKKGFDPEVVRMLLKDDLNQWLKERVEEKWTIFIRTDAKKEYDDIEVKGKKKKEEKAEEESDLTKFIKDQLEKED